VQGGSHLHIGHTLAIRVVNPFHAVDQVGERCDGQYWI